MKPARRTGWAVLVAACLAAVGWLAPHEARAPGEAVVLAARPVAMRSAPRLALPPREAASAGVRSQPPRAPAAVSKRLQDALASSTDWRAFALDAMQRPREGGYFYARYAIETCARDAARLRQAANAAAAKEVSATGTIDARVDAAVERYLSDCASFVPGEAAELLRKLDALQADGLDPLVSAWQAAFDAAQHPERGTVREATARIIEVGDPLMMSTRNLLPMIATADVEGRQKMGLVFEGRMLVPQDGPGYVLAGLALDLGTCVPSAPCAMDRDLRIACASQRVCRTRDEAVRARLDEIGGTGEDWQQVLRMAARVRDAIAGRDATFFVR